MVFNLPVPTNADLENMNLLDGLLRHWQDFFAFFVSFFMIGVLWINHHDIFRIIYRADHIVSLLNILLLLGITLMPFTTRLMATHLQTEHSQTAAVIYSGTYLITTIFFNLLWRYAAYKRRLIGKNVSDADINVVYRNYNIGLLLYLIAFVVSFLSAPLNLIINFGLALFFALPLRSNWIARTSDHDDSSHKKPVSNLPMDSNFTRSNGFPKPTQKP
ncbi:MAG: TMEM175 family protein [Anaerolineae bacterium]|nr:TMEM175 family protein [Anaerolineae bacterium]